MHLVRLAVLWLAAGLLFASVAAAEQKISFTRQIKPILSGKCFACHGPDEKERKAELRLDVRDEAVPSVIKPGDGEHSEVVVRIVTGDADARLAVTWPASWGRPLCTVGCQRILPVLRLMASTTYSW